jgi:hypothetical protein
MNVNPPVDASQPLVAEGVNQLRDLWEAEDPEWARTAVGGRADAQSDREHALVALVRVYALAFDRTRRARNSIYKTQNPEQVINWFARCLRFQVSLCRCRRRDYFSASNE